MFGYNYHFTMNSDKNLIKLKPTLGTYAKAFAPSLVIWGSLGLMALVENMQSKRRNTNQENHETA